MLKHQSKSKDIFLYSPILVGIITALVTALITGLIVMAMMKFACGQNRVTDNAKRDA